MDQLKVGSFIAALRKEKALTQLQLGQALGVTNKTVSRWETGEYLPDFSLVALLCSTLDISINEFLSGERLADTEFRAQAQNNLLSLLAYEATLKKRKRLRDFCNGTGTGLLISALYSPNNAQRSAVIAAGIALILAGWYFGAKLDKVLLPQGSAEAP
ncbi:MAG: helix-turn-helix transcriptional regulator [Pygmaiobacter sp.]|nr:helix-turn-helix transcriptional regulator [Pygmaiobacter sp.]